MKNKWHELFLKKPDALAMAKQMGHFHTNANLVKIHLSQFHSFVLSLDLILHHALNGIDCVVVMKATNWFLSRVTKSK